MGAWVCRFFYCYRTFVDVKLLLGGHEGIGAKEYMTSVPTAIMEQIVFVGVNCCMLCLSVSWHRLSSWHVLFQVRCRWNEFDVFFLIFGPVYKSHLAQLPR